MECQLEAAEAQIAELHEQQASATRHCERRAAEAAVSERQSSVRLEQLQLENRIECIELQAERRELADCRDALALSESQVKELAHLAERQEEERHQTEAAVLELAAAGRCRDARLEELCEEREGQRREFEEHIEWLTQQLRSEKRGYEDHIARLRAAEKRNEDRIFLLMHRQQCVKPEQPRRGSIAHCGC